MLGLQMMELVITVFGRVNENVACRHNVEM